MQVFVSSMDQCQLSSFDGASSSHTSHSSGELVTNQMSALWIYRTKWIGAGLTPKSARSLSMGAGWQSEAPGRGWIQFEIHASSIHGIFGKHEVGSLVEWLAV